jgi:peptide/nickel transport system permease protein
MAVFLLKRIGVMVLTALCLTIVVFSLVNLKPNLVKLAKEQTGSRITEQQVEVWLDQNGYNRPLPVRYAEWLGDVVRGDFGQSTRFNAPVSEVLWPRLWLTAKLMFWVMVVMVPGALLIGVLAGMREGTFQDRALSTVAIGTTSTPEYVSGVVLTVIFASQMVGLQWFSGSATSAADDGITFYNFTLPVLTIAIYGMGYIARMTRASMAEVMTQQYIRTARL